MSNKTAFLRTLVHNKKLINFTPLAITRSHRQGFHQQDEQRERRSGYGKVTAVTLFSLTLFGAAVKTKEKNKKVVAGEKIAGLPTYRADEVSKHSNIDSFWVTYKHGVYDVTAFLPSHPGGEQIKEAAGLSVEPFWNIYGQHHTKEVYKILESYRIGNLHDDDVIQGVDDGLWASEPKRDPRLLVKTQRPFNAETPPEALCSSFYTPSELFYVRQHMPVPELEADTHTVTVTVRLPSHSKRVQFPLKDLVKQFPRVTIPAALMCAGNRRTEMNKVKEVKGLPWTVGAISNAAWSGVPLRAVLLHCGVTDADCLAPGKHVIFQGADIDATGVHFSTSIPLAMAMSAEAGVLLATHMNGEELPPDHGYPVRVVVPGAPAVRSVKWLESITVSEDESPSHWHQKDYRSFNSSTTWETADFPSAPPVYNLPVTSAICHPLDGATVPVQDSTICVKGYAYSGGGAGIVRVDVSTDCGKSWTMATLTKAPDCGRQQYSWTLWTANLPVPPKEKQMDIWVKATDSNFNTQPENFDHIWNIRGILSNAYHKIKVKLDR